MEDLTYELPLLQPTAGSSDGRVSASAGTTNEAKNAKRMTIARRWTEKPDGENAQEQGAQLQVRRADGDGTTSQRRLTDDP